MRRCHTVAKIKVVVGKISSNIGRNIGCISISWNHRCGKALVIFRIIMAMIIAVSHSDETVGLCCLCSGCKPAYRLNFFIDDHGTTCRALALEMADPSNSSKQDNTVCRTLQSKHRQVCCDSNFKPVEIPQNPIAGDKNPYSNGKYNACYLCSGGIIPGNPDTLVAVLNHPDPDTCKDLYWYALAGKIEDTWCKPMQKYYEQPCGCASGSTPPGGGSDGGGSNDSTTVGLLQKLTNWLARLFARSS